MKKPMIGVVPLVDTQRESYWMIPGYMKGIEQAGGIPFMLPLTSKQIELAQITDMLDGFLLTGGQDVSPHLYGSNPSQKCGESSVERDRMEEILFRLALEQNKPILGICRGIQLINVILGGTLYQDLPTEYLSKTKHHQLPPYDVPCHEVEIVTDSPLYDLLQTDKIKVNSYHHQAIKEPAPQIAPMAVSEDGLIEAICMPEKSFVWAVQWHPELSYEVDEDSRRIFKKFVESSRGSNLQ